MAIEMIQAEFKPAITHLRNMVLATERRDFQGYKNEFLGFLNEAEQIEYLPKDDKFRLRVEMTVNACMTYFDTSLYSTERREQARLEAVRISLQLPRPNDI